MNEQTSDHKHISTPAVPSSAVQPDGRWSCSLVADYVEHYTPKIWMEHLDNDRITIMHFEDLSPATLQEWQSGMESIGEQWPQGRPNLACLDVTKVTIKEVQNFVKAASGARKMGPAQRATSYIAFWMSRTPAAQLLSAVTRSALLINPGTRIQIVHTREDALRWLTYHRKRLFAVLPGDQ